MKPFDIAPFALPNGPKGELKFEEARDIEAVEVAFTGPPPSAPRLQYMRKLWPEMRFEYPANVDIDRPMEFGWKRMDDLFTPEWVDAAVDVTAISPRTLRFTFKPLRNEIPDFAGAETYDEGDEEEHHREKSRHRRERIHADHLTKVDAVDGAQKGLQDVGQHHRRKEDQKRHPERRAIGHGLLLIKARCDGVTPCKLGVRTCKGSERG